MTGRPLPSDSTAPVLRVRGLTVTRRGTAILRGIDWTVNPGEMWTVLGANGSGKTSMLNCLTGYLTPAGGEVTVLGETYGASDWIGLRRRIGLVSSGIRQRIDDGEIARDILSSARYGQINFRRRLTADDRRRTESVARRVRCTRLLDRRWAVLSQGERQRLLTGCALITEPELLILDEPCAGLDPVARARFIAFLQMLATRRNAPAIVLVTHHLEEIPPACTHVLTLRNGRVHAAGPVRDVLRAEVLSGVFGWPVVVSKTGDTWRLDLSPDDAGRAVF